MKRFALHRSLRSEPEVAVSEASARDHGVGQDGPDARSRLAAAATTLRSTADGLLRQLKTSVHSLDAEIAKRSSEIARLESRAAAAAQGRKLRTLGMVPGLRVVLYEDRIETPDGVFPLTPDVHARTDTQGMKQSVQGWVFKSDQDRREIYLHINGPGWHSLQRYDMKYSMKQPQKIMEMAYAIGDAAAACDEARTAIRTRADEANRELLSRLTAELPEPDALAAVTSMREAIASVETELVDAEGRAGDLSLNRLDRPMGHLASARSKLQEASTLGTDALMRWTAANAAWRTRIEDVTATFNETRSEEQPVATGRLNAADPATILVSPVPPLDRSTTAEAEATLRLIEGLGDLRAKGLVSEEEFAAKKSELLNRL